jgi:choline dehydrogenase-like flavoprotein
MAWVHNPCVIELASMHVQLLVQEHVGSMRCLHAQLRALPHAQANIRTRTCRHAHMRTHMCIHAHHDTYTICTAYTRRSRHAYINEPAGPGAPFHGVGGTMNVERPRYENPLHENFFEACANVGMVANPDFNNWDHPQVCHKCVYG